MKKILALGAAVLALLLTAVPAFAAELPMNISFQLTVDGVDFTGRELQPDREYRFPVLVRYEDEVPSHLREEEMEGKRFIVSIQAGGEAVYAPSVEADGGRYWLVVKTKPSYATKAVQVELLVRLRQQNGGDLSSETVRLTVGSSRMSDEDLATAAEGGSLRVDNSYPVVTKKQFQRLAEANSYRAVTLAGDGWEYTVNVADLPDLNLYSTGAVSQEMLQKYPDREFYFLSFPAAPDFGVTGTMVLDVERLTEFDGEFYLYRRLGDRLYYLKTDYDEDEGTLTFRPSQLGSYIIANGKLGDVEQGSGAVTGGAVLGAVAAETAPNPETGGGQRPAAPAALLALAALSAGALTTFRKR